MSRGKRITGAVTWQGRTQDNRRIGAQVEQLITDTPPAAHTHPQAEVDDLVDDLDAIDDALVALALEDSALDARVDALEIAPPAHAASHQAGGGDAIKLDDLAAPDDTTDLNATAAAHGLLPKLSNVATEFLNGQGAWATPAGGGGPRTPQRSSATGALDDVDLTDGHTWLILDGAAPVISGFEVAGVAPSDGDSVLVDYVGTGSARVEDQSTGTGSAEANRVIGVSVRGQFLGQGGRLLCVYDGTEDRWRLSLIDPGAPIPVPFDADDFVASSGVWTVEEADVATFTFQQRGKILNVSVWLNSTSKDTTAGGTLAITLPGGFTVARSTGFAGVRKDNGTWGGMLIFVQTSTPTRMDCSKQDLSDWTASVNNTNVIGQCFIEVE